MRNDIDFKTINIQICVLFLYQIYIPLLLSSDYLMNHLFNFHSQTWLTFTIQSFFLKKLLVSARVQHSFYKRKLSVTMSFTECDLTALTLCNSIFDCSNDSVAIKFMKLAPEIFPQFITVKDNKQQNDNNNTNNNNNNNNNHTIPHQSDTDTTQSNDTIYSRDELEAANQLLNMRSSIITINNKSTLNIMDDININDSDDYDINHIMDNIQKRMDKKNKNKNKSSSSSKNKNKKRKRSSSSSNNKNNNNGNNNKKHHRRKQTKKFKKSNNNNNDLYGNNLNNDSIDDIMIDNNFQSMMDDLNECIINDSINNNHKINNNYNGNGNGNGNGNRKRKKKRKFSLCSKSLNSLNGKEINLKRIYPFKCKYNKCFKLFETKQLLKKHEINDHRLINNKIRNKSNKNNKKMEKEKPFKCKHCHRSFKSKGSLTKHENVHSGQKKFVCKFCKKRYIQKWRWEKHQQQCQKNNA